MFLPSQEALTFLRLSPYGVHRNRVGAFRPVLTSCSMFCRPAYATRLIGMRYE
jgi:hypothetical protein